MGRPIAGGAERLDAAPARYGWWTCLGRRATDPTTPTGTAPDYDAYAEAIIGALMAALTRFDLRSRGCCWSGTRAGEQHRHPVVDGGGGEKLADHKTWVNIEASQNHLPNILSANWYYHSVAVTDADPAPSETEIVDLVGPLSRSIPWVRHGRCRA